MHDTIIRHVVSYFVFGRAPRANGYSDTDDRKVNTFAFAGVVPYRRIHV
jgi:hypothetical protein